MAYYEVYTDLVSATIMLQRFATFLAANGWTIDLSAVYSTSYWRVHCHRGNAHFDMYTSTMTTLNCYGCTGFNGGAIPSAQPGAHVTAGTSTILSQIAGSKVLFISTEAGVYWSGFTIASGYYYWHFMLHSFNKIGTWSDGFMTATGYGVMFSNLMYGTPYFTRLYYNGGWSERVVAGGLHGCYAPSDLASRAYNMFNAGIALFPMLFYIAPTFDSTKRIPMAYVLGFYRGSAGDLYQSEELMTIGSDAYLVIPPDATYAGKAAFGDFFFKLGA